mmetsp:Transcript_38918/g.84712  ORF Transcript_38918/g.84712 Transcript_38918/m.84712 type:complete len:201 (-) Transcript_38918:151-753(-)
MFIPPRRSTSFMESLLSASAAAGETRIAPSAPSLVVLATSEESASAPGRGMSGSSGCALSPTLWRRSCGGMVTVDGFLLIFFGIWDCLANPCSSPCNPSMLVFNATASAKVIRLAGSAKRPPGDCDQMLLARALAPCDRGHRCITAEGMTCRLRKPSSLCMCSGFASGSPRASGSCPPFGRRACVSGATMAHPTTAEKKQ